MIPNDNAENEEMNNANAETEDENEQIRDERTEAIKAEDYTDTASFEPIRPDDEYTRGHAPGKREYMNWRKALAGYKFKKLLAICVSVILAVSLISGAVVYVSSLDRIIVNNGYNALENGNYDEAIIEFDKAIAKDGKNIDAYAGKALAQISDGQDSGASETVNTMFATCSGGESVSGVVYNIGSGWRNNTGGNNSVWQGTNGGNTEPEHVDPGTENLAETPEPAASPGSKGAEYVKETPEPTASPGSKGGGEETIREILVYLFNWICRYNIANDCAEQNEILMNMIEQNGLNAQYGIYSRPPQPTTDCPSGTYNKPVNVNLYSSGDGTICYIVGDGEFALKNLTIYEETIYIKRNNSSTRIRAAVYDSLYIPSGVLDLNYALEREPLSSPTYSHNSGSYTGGFYLILSNPNDDGTIYYTTDGAEPTTDSNAYSGRIYIGEGSSTIKARVIDTQNEVSSQTVSLTYSVTKPKPTPTPKRSGRTCPVCGSNNTAFDSSINAYKCYDCGNDDRPEDIDDFVRCPNCGSFNVGLGNQGVDSEPSYYCGGCSYVWYLNGSSSSVDEPSQIGSDFDGETCPNCGSKITYDVNGYGWNCSSCGSHGGESGYYSGASGGPSDSSGGVEARG